MCHVRREDKGLVSSFRGIAECGLWWLVRPERFDIEFTVDGGEVSLRAGLQIFVLRGSERGEWIGET